VFCIFWFKFLAKIVDKTKNGNESSFFDNHCVPFGVGFYCKQNLYTFRALFSISLFKQLSQLPPFGWGEEKAPPPLSSPQPKGESAVNTILGQKKIRSAQRSAKHCMRSQ
jgi:hypothetical protein